MLEAVYFYHEDDGTSRARYGDLFLPASINSLKKYLQCDFHITIIKHGALPQQIDTSNITLIEDKGLGSVAAQAKAFLELEYDYWLHLDDDVILHRPIGLDTFINADGKPVIRHRSKPYDYPPDELKNTWKQSIVNTDKLIEEALKKNGIAYKGRYHTHHSPHFYSRQLCRLMRVLIGKELKRTSETNGRRADMVCDIALGGLFAAAGDCVMSSSTIYNYAKADEDKTAEQIRAFPEPFILFNDAPNISEGVREFLDEFKEESKPARKPLITQTEVKAAEVKPEVKSPAVKNIAVKNIAVKNIERAASPAANPKEIDFQVFNRRAEICGHCKNKVYNICTKHNQRIGEIIWKKERCEIW